MWNHPPKLSNLAGALQGISWDSLSKARQTRWRLKELGQIAYGTEELSLRAGELMKLLEAAFVDKGQKSSFSSSASELQDFLRKRRAFVLKQIAEK